jgi:hypothetical protein
MHATPTSRGFMNSLRISTFLFLTTIGLMGCDDPSDADDFGELSFRNIGWDDVVCTSGATRCYGHRPLAAELWSPLVSHCELNYRIYTHSWVETDDGYAQICDPGGEPQTFDDVRCFHPGIAGEVKCFGGFDGWYTEVGPTCDFGTYTRTTWKAGACDTYFGSYDYDAVVASNTYVIGRAFDGPDRFAVVPECIVQSSGVVADPFACL